MTSIHDWLAMANIDANSMLALLVNTWFKASALLVVSGILAALLKKSPASTRHIVWCIGLSVLLVLPVLSLLLPPLSLPIWPRVAVFPAGHAEQGLTAAAEIKPDRSSSFSSPPGPPKPLKNPASAVSPAGGAQQVVEAPQESANPPSGKSNSLPAIASTAGAATISGNPPWGMILLLVWLGGFLASLSRWMAGLTGALLIVRRSKPIADSECVADMGYLSHSLGIGRRVRLLEYDGGSAPMTSGIIRPTIILPPSHCDWPPERRKVVLLHELSHVKRWDCLAQAIAQIVCALYWLNPLVWLAAQRLRLESENACDDEVIGSGTKASAYAGHLLEMARTFGLAAPGPRSALTIVRASQLESRLRLILDPHRRNRRGGERLRRAFVLGGLVLIASGLAALAPYQRPAASVRTRSASQDTGPGRGQTPADFSVDEANTASRRDAGAQDAGHTSNTVANQLKPGDYASDPPAGSQSQGSTEPVKDREPAFFDRAATDKSAGSSPAESTTSGQAVQATRQNDKSDTAVQALIAALKDSDPGVRSNAIWALSVNGGKATQDALITALRDDDARVRSQAAWGLGIHGDQKAVEPLIAALRDASPRVIAQAAWALGMRGDIRASDALRGLLNNQNDHVRRQAAWALGMLLMRSSDGDDSEDEDDRDVEESVVDVPNPHPHPNPNPHPHPNPRPRVNLRIRPIVEPVIRPMITPAN
jgi:beta-lactamase regulating signal transducer with metallopeptidase domain